MKKILLFQLFFLLLGLKTNAQSSFITYPTASQAITRGLDSTYLTVQIAFPSACTNVNITIKLTGSSTNAGLITYIPNSFTYLTTSPTTPTVTENISNMQSPVFNIGNVTTGQIIQFKIRRRADCGLASSSHDDVIVSGTGCSFSDVSPSSNPYDLNAAAFTISPPAAIANAAIATPYNRLVSVINGGNGCIDTLFFWIVYPPNSVQLNSLKIGANIITPQFTNGDSSYFVITGTNLGPTGKICNAESILFTENITLLKCGPITKYGAAWSAYTNNYCQQTSATAGVSMANTFPTLSIANNIATLTSCYKDAPRNAGAIITNIGTGAATNVVLTTGSSYVNIPRTDSYGYIDTATLMVTPSVGVPFHPTPNMFTGYTYMVASTFYSPACNWGKIANVELTMPSTLIIKAGENITVSYKIVYCDATAACDLHWEAIYLGTNVKYKNECGNQNYNVNGVENTDRPYNRAVLSAFQYPAQIIAGDCFNVTVSTVQYVTNVFGKSYVDYKIKLPLGCTLNTANIIGINAVPHPGYPKVVGDTAIVRYAVAEAGGPVRFNLCSTIASCGTQSITGIIESSPDSSCTKNNKSTTCQTNPINFVCPSPCPTGGTVPTYWKFSRTNFGLPDNNYDKFPDASGVVDPLKIDVDRYRAGDTMHSQYRSYIIPQTQDRAGNPNSIPNWNHVNANWNFSKHIWVPAGNATVTIKRSGVTTVVPAVPFTTVVYGKNYTADFSNGPATLTALAPFLPNDSVIVDADFKLLDTLLPQSNTGPYTLVDDGVSGIRLAESPDVIVLTHHVYASTMANPIAANQFTCFIPQYNANVLHLSHFTYIYGANFSGCNTARPYIYSYTRVLGGYSANYFPGEYRPSFIPDTATITYPIGMSVVPGTQNIGGIYGGLTNAIAGNYITISGSPLTGQKVTLDFKSAFAANPNIVIESEGTYWYFSMEVRASCVTNSTFYTPISEIGHVYHWPSNNNEARYEVNEITMPGTTINLASNYDASSKPNVNIASPNAIVAPISDTAKWIVNLNNSTTQNVPVNFLKINPVGGFANYVVKIAGVIQTPNSSGIYALGTIANGGSITNLTIEATTNNCSLDSFKIQTGWDCAAIPTGAELAGYTCWKDFWLKATPQPSQIQLNVTKQPIVSPATDIALCATTTTEFTILSALANYADNPEFRVTPPTGLIISMGEIEYPLGSGNWQTITPTITGGLYIYKVENHTAISPGGLPGTLTFATAAERIAKLKLTFTTSCNFVSGSRIAVQQRADRPCGNPIPNNLGYNTISRTQPINITGGSITGSVSFSLETTPAPSACLGLTNFKGKITPIGTATILTDTIVVTIPAGVAYVGPVNGATLAAGPLAGIGGTQILKLTLPIGTPSGTQIAYNFDVKPTTNSGCGNFLIQTEAQRTIAPLNCNGTLCTNGAKTIMGAVEDTIKINKPQIAITNVTLASGYYAVGQTISVNVTANNSGNIVAPAGSLLVEFFCSGSAVPFGAQYFPVSVAPLSLATSSFSIMVPNIPTCLSGNTLMAVIRPSLTTCICDSTSYMLAGALPVTITDFNAVKNNTIVKLKWTVSNEINIAHYDIYRSIDAINFVKVGTAITANAQAKYETTDDISNIKNNIIYYKLGINATNNAIIKYSKIVTILNSNNETSSLIYPNPFNDKITIEFVSNTNQTIVINIIDMLGKKILAKEIKVLKGNNSISLATNTLATGTYILKIIDKAGNKLERNKIVKQ